MTDWNKVADSLRRCVQGEHHQAALDLCQRMAKGELVERKPIADAIDEADECGDDRIDIDRLKHMVGGYYG